MVVRKSCNHVITCFGWKPERNFCAKTWMVKKLPSTPVWAIFFTPPPAAIRQLCVEEHTHDLINSIDRQWTVGNLSKGGSQSEPSRALATWGKNWWLFTTQQEISSSEFSTRISQHQKLQHNSISLLNSFDSLKPASRVEKINKLLSRGNFIKIHESRVSLKDFHVSIHVSCYLWVTHSPLPQLILTDVKKLFTLRFFYETRAINFTTDAWLNFLSSCYESRQIRQLKGVFIHVN